MRSYRKNTLKGTGMKSGTSKLYKHPNADTLYMTIPASVVQDSTFPFKEDDEVFIEISDNPHGLVVTKGKKIK